MFYIDLAFAAKSVLAAANEHSLPKICYLQQISVRCRSELPVAN